MGSLGPVATSIVLVRVPCKVLPSILMKGTSSTSIVRGTRVFQPYFFLLDQPLCSLWYKIYACHRTHHQRRKRTEAGEIISRRTIIITVRTGTSGTATATGTILILYRFLITLGLSNRGWWCGGGVVGIQVHRASSTANATTGL